jgi:hypothetical protein
VSGNDPNSFSARGEAGSGNLYWTLQVAYEADYCTDTWVDEDKIVSNVTIDSGATSIRISNSSIYSPNHGDFGNKHLEGRAIRRASDRPAATSLIGLGRTVMSARMADVAVRRDVPGFAENEPGIPGPAIEHVFAHTDDLVIVTTGCEAYPTGIAFRLLVLSKPPIDFVTEFAFGIEQRRHAGSLDLSASATLRNGSQQPIVLGVFGGGATRARADLRFWVPLPDDAVAAQVRLTWPTMQLDETARIDVRLLRLMLDPGTVRNQQQP